MSHADEIAVGISIILRDEESNWDGDRHVRPGDQADGFFMFLQRRDGGEIGLQRREALGSDGRDIEMGVVEILDLLRFARRAARCPRLLR